MSEEDWSTWGSVPWSPVRDSKNGDPGDIIGWQKNGVPYLPGGVSLQTLDVWIPASDDDASNIPDARDLPKRPGHWLVYIHGGAWRDPMTDSSSFAATAFNILQTVYPSGSRGKVSGMASLNYRLSPYPGHATNPSPPSDPGAAPDPGRLAKHPDHIRDVLAGISFLQQLGGVSGTYVLGGHSCGATLAFQAAMNPERWGLDTAIAKPSVLVGVNGLYDLAGFIAHPPPRYEGLQDAYEEFTRAAFGDEEGAWKVACPASAASWPQEWKEGKRVVLVQSREDTLVPYDQLEEMRAYLQANSSLEVQELEATGDHNGIWQKGDGLAQIFCEVLSGSL